MKKLLNLLMVFLFVSAMVACGGNAETTDDSGDVDTTATEQQDTNTEVDTSGTDADTTDTDATTDETEGGH